MTKANKCPLKAQSLTASKAKELLHKADGKARLVQFHSPHCPHCSEVTPEVDKVARELCGETDVCRLNVDSVVGDQLAEEFKVEGLPTVAVIRDGKLLGQIEGAGEGSEATDFLQLIQKFLTK